MKTEKVVLSFIAITVGVLVAGVVFYLYQATKTISPSKIKTVSIQTPTPLPKPAIFLTVDSPKDEEVFDKRTIVISGKTAPASTIIISTQTDDQVITPAQNGNFSTSVVIEDGQNIIEITAVLPSGEETKIIRAVTFSTETF